MVPSGDEKAEEFAESMRSQIDLTEDKILEIANLPVLENLEISLLQEVLGRLSTPCDDFSNNSSVFIRFPSSTSQSRLLLILLHHPKVRRLVTFCLYFVLRSL